VIALPSSFVEDNSEKLKTKHGSQSGVDRGNTAIVRKLSGGK